MESAHTQAFRLICAETIFHKNNTDYVLAKKSRDRLHSPSRPNLNNQ